MLRRLTIAAVACALVATACSASVLTLEVGDCFDDPGTFSQVDRVDVVDCAEPHDNEVYAVITYQGTEWPGSDAMQDAALTQCLDAFEPFIGIAYEVSRWDIAALWPTEESWNEADDREIICAAYDVNGERVTGSARGSGE